jgi:hypothetical protein
MGYYLPYVYCNLPSHPLSGAALLGIVAFAQTLSLVLTGVSAVNNDLALAFLLVWCYYFLLFYSTALSEEFTQPSPVCTLLEDPALEALRPSGFPSWETLSIFTLSTFVLLNQFLTRRTLPGFIWTLLILSPFVTVLALYLTDNETLGQLLISLVIGIGFGVFWAIRYHFFLKWYIFGTFEREFLKKLFQFQPLTAVFGQTEDDEDHDIIMWRNFPQSEKSKSPSQLEEASVLFNTKHKL